MDEECAEWIARAKRAMKAFEKRETRRMELKLEQFNQKAKGSPLGELFLRWRGLCRISAAKETEPERRQIEAEIGRMIMESCFLRIGGEIDRKAVRLVKSLFEPVPKARFSERLDLRRVSSALQAFCEKHGRIPTKKELREETASHPIDFFRPVYGEKSLIFAKGLNGDKKALSEKRFSSAIAALGLSGLPEGERGNPSWKK